MSQYLRIATLVFFCTVSKAYDETAVIDRINDMAQSKAILGLSYSLIKNNDLVAAGGYGFVDNDKTVPVNEHTPFWIASLTKSFVSLVFLRMEQDGLIELDYLAKNTPKFVGLCEWLSSTEIPFATDLRCHEDITIDHILNHQANFKPGTQFIYNPILYSRLSRLLEHEFGLGVDHVEGRHNMLARLLDQYIIDPANMTRTMSSQWDKNKMDVYFDMTHGHKTINGQHVQMRSPERHIAGGAGVVSTAYDLALYDLAIEKNIIANDQIKAKMHNPKPFNNQKPSPYAYGFYIQNVNGHQVIYHTGWDPEIAKSALYIRVPQLQSTMILLANTEALWWGNSLSSPDILGSDFSRMFLTQLGVLN
jgi:CubicO group peptidase (beta-lactamase class C family)